MREAVAAIDTVGLSTPRHLAGMILLMEHPSLLFMINKIPSRRSLASTFFSTFPMIDVPTLLEVFLILTKRGTAMHAALQLLSALTRGFHLRNYRQAIVHHIKAADFYRANTCFDEAADRCLLKASHPSKHCGLHASVALYTHQFRPVHTIRTLAQRHLALWVCPSLRRRKTEKAQPAITTWDNICLLDLVFRLEEVESHPLASPTTPDHVNGWAC